MGNKEAIETHKINTKAKDSRIPLKSLEVQCGTWVVRACARVCTYHLWSQKKSAFYDAYEHNPVG